MLHNAPFQPILAHFRQAKNRQNTLKLFTIFTNLRCRQAIADALKAFSAAGWGNEYLRAHLYFYERHKDPGQRSRRSNLTAQAFARRWLLVVLLIQQRKRHPTQEKVLSL